MIDKIKKMIPERYKGPVRALFGPSSVPELDKFKGSRKVVVALAGFYQNLGDMALTYAQGQFIKKVLPDFEVLYFPSDHTYSRMKALKNVVGAGDIVTIIGGGNMDDLYPSLENARRYIVRSFPDLPVISFPQTMAFSETASGQRALKRSAQTYESHKCLTLFSRESQSFGLMTERFPEACVELCPDTVLSLNPDVPTRERSGIMITMRSDKEVLIDAAELAEIHDIVSSKTSDIIIKDTVDVSLEECQLDTFEQTLHEFWELVSSRKVVITDRLHCMIFCVITGTPVVVLPNSNHKIRGTYENWLSELPYVRYLDAFEKDEFAAAVNEMWALEENQIPALDLATRYSSLRQALLEAAGRV